MNEHSDSSGNKGTATRPAPESSRPSKNLDPAALAFEMEGIPPWRQQLSQRIVGGFLAFVRFCARRWLTIFNVVNIGFFLVAFATPLAASAGWTWFSQPVFDFCHIVCVQNPAHSFSINGHQMALCERCLAIYAMLGLLGLLFHLVRYRLRPLKFWQYAVYCLPMAVDATTQLFGWRQSTWELRLLTGGLFGFATVWYMYPQIERWMEVLKDWVARQGQPNFRKSVA